MNKFTKAHIIKNFFSRFLFFFLPLSTIYYLLSTIRRIVMRPIQRLFVGSSFITRTSISAINRTATALCQLSTRTGLKTLTTALFAFLPFYLFTFSPLTAYAVSTVSTGATATSTAFNNARKLARDNSGNLYLAYIKTSGGSWQIFVAKSTDNGASWADMGGAPIQTLTGYEQWYPSLAIDSQNNLHCVWEGKRRGRSRTCPTGQPQGLPLQKYSGGSWSAWTNSQTILGYYQLYPLIAFDSQNNLHYYVVKNIKDCTDPIKSEDENL